MKKQITYFLLILLAGRTSATTMHEQLCAFNPNWKTHSLPSANCEALQITSDKMYVQLHLTCVLPILKKNKTHHLSAAQYAQRMKLLGLLDGYRLAGNFPVNSYLNERVPVFIDANGTYCAVAFLMQQSGYNVLAKRIAKNSNLAWLKDMHDEGIGPWQKFSGFSMEELKLIQGAYDNYLHDALMRPDKHEIPQKPECATYYFDNNNAEKLPPSSRIWCRGEGKNGVLHGRWEQNYAIGIPWIVGFYENGKRSGQWMEYYQGTKQLCRTECWRNDKLNGIRKRFSREGVLIEEIMFKDGVAITKTNYDFRDSLVWVRRPLDSSTVASEVYTMGGALIAFGKQKIHNPGNLLWFQNIELTALNSYAMHTTTAGYTNNNLVYNDPYFSTKRNRLFGETPLVEYKNEGRWVFYPEYNAAAIAAKSENNLWQHLKLHYKHFGHTATNVVVRYDDIQTSEASDSLVVDYGDGYIENLALFGAKNPIQLHVTYYQQKSPEVSIASYIFSGYGVREIEKSVREIGLMNPAGERIGTWKYFDRQGVLRKIEQYLHPWKEEDYLTEEH